MEYSFQEFTGTQRQVYQEAGLAYQTYLERLQQDRAYRGGMHWKKIRGGEYLYRYRDRAGNGQSLGPRSPHTEQLYADFSRDREAQAARLAEARQHMTEQARFCRAARLKRLPRAAGRILTQLAQHPLGGKLLIIGATALAAYEFAAGVFVETSGASDRLGNPRRLNLAGEGSLAWEELLELLRRKDRSFAPLAPECCGAVNRDGFQVRLYKTDARPAGRPRPVTAPGASQPLPPEAGRLHYLFAMPKFSRVVIGADGAPVPMAVPDPRAFALNRLWWSSQVDRDPAQRARDLHQALAVAGLVLRYLPQYDFSPAELEMFPREIGLEIAGSEEPLQEVIMEY